MRHLKLLSVLFCFLLSSPVYAADLPNIVFIFSDDHATQAIGAYGHPLTKLAPTPQLDRLASSGMRFDRCLVTNSICGPSRAVILTGKYSHLNGFIANESKKFDGSQMTFPKLLQKAGYQTAVIGKWHLGSEPTGFDHWEVFPGQGSYYNPDFRTPNGRIRVEGYSTEVVTDKSIDWLKNKRDEEKPFMLMMQHKAPHRNWAPAFKYMDLYEDVTFPEPETLFDNYEGRGTAAKKQDMTISFTMQMNNDLKVDSHVPGTKNFNRNKRLTDEQRKIHDATFIKRSEELKRLNPKGKDLTRWKYQAYVRDYLKCIKSVDDSVGQMLDYLKVSGLDKNTVVIYSSDQGFYLGEHGWFDKRFMFDESYRTPLLISWPEKIKPGTSTRALVSNLDFAQTFLDIAGVSSDPEMQGKSLVPLFSGQAKAKDFRQYHYYHYYEFPGWHMVQRHEGVYDGRYKLIHYYEINEWELIDMKTDPHEMKSQYDNPEYASEVKRLKQALEDVRKQYKVPEENPEPQLVKDPYRYASPEWRAKFITENN